MFLWCSTPVGLFTYGTPFMNIILLHRYLGFLKKHQGGIVNPQRWIKHQGGIVNPQRLMCIVSGYRP